MPIRRGDTVIFPHPPVLAAWAAVGGKKESEGPLAAEFDELSADNRFGQSSWEAAEKYMQLRAARLCLQKAALPQEKVQLALAGDLQAQCTASSYAMRELGVPFAGLFGACSTMAEGLALGAALCEGGAARNLLAMASSHFCAAERQFRRRFRCAYGRSRFPEGWPEREPLQLPADARNGPQCGRCYRLCRCCWYPDQHFQLSAF